ncbi:adenylate kinase [Streptoalloteichus tenebrarius]|uniref:Adenylate kinase n=1 Tax=Streptoalloteichus tenebrarius (strain ATCC 17920 / DSM 40477 / JCM 4838 / CBS 697.72 / NBRC 16177 / NCIMB 11028 / NRRL B-12390 / A12253. 1 / ISP 5477) TaxID=1933 RepID=A0ABT1I027_STRSD|nr:AAA family ATPase [Streptoalloteichus tenebrarius]MCP2261133.1 adenylate kinase [Streptoalloteichus tenebrarius]BFF03958.1 adenylate kinase [Streptoalloteichus tenebrarius]
MPHDLPLGPDDPLPHRPRRVLVAGASGSGKTSLAREIARRLALPAHELDALHHGPNWTPRPEFVADVEAFSAEEQWVTEWQYSKVRRLLAERADTLVWLDHPRSLVMRRVVRRTVLRRIRREQLWNGNVEPPLHNIFTDPENVIRWSWSTYARTGESVRALMSDPALRHLVVVRLRGQRQVDAWLDGSLRAAARSEENA